MNYYTIRIYTDDQPRTFGVARFDWVMASDKDAARTWGEAMAKHLGLVNASVGVDWHAEVTLENLK